MGNHLSARAQLALLAGLGLIVAVGIAGCSSSSPRFKSGEERPSTVVQEEDDFRFAAKVREEERREDDRKVDPATIQKKFSGTTRYSNLTSLGINRDRVLLDAVSYLGVPYKFGGNTKKGIDCSAFTSSVYSTALQRSIPRSTSDQYRVGIPVRKDSLQFGDLVFFNTTGRTPSHVGLYIEDDLFVHASVTFGVTISSLESTYYRKRFVGARRLVE